MLSPLHQGLRTHRVWHLGRNFQFTMHYVMNYGGKIFGQRLLFPSFRPRAGATSDPCRIALEIPEAQLNSPRIAWQISAKTIKLGYSK
jgi:hypothetical protein